MSYQRVICSLFDALKFKTKLEATLLDKRSIRFLPITCGSRLILAFIDIIFKLKELPCDICEDVEIKT
jgi:hypothetical protein